jgi:hypothetical protein
MSVSSATHQIKRLDFFRNWSCQMAEYTAHIRQTLIKEIKVLFGEPEDRRLTFLRLNQRSILKEIFKKRLRCEDVFG